MAKGAGMTMDGDGQIATGSRPEGHALPGGGEVLDVSSQRLHSLATTVVPGSGRSREQRVTFARAAVRLSDAEEHSDEARSAAAEAATALLELSELNDTEALREILRPDPVAGRVTWTVACYQIGDLTPSSLRDFPDPVDAVGMLAHCPDASHVAAELIASTDQGLRWPAVVRAGGALGFQLLSNGLARSGADDEALLSLALDGWESRLSRWSARPDQLRTPTEPETVAPPPAGGALPLESPALSDQQAQAPGAVQELGALLGDMRAILHGDGGLLRREDLAALEARLTRLEELLPVGPVASGGERPVASEPRPVTAELAALARQEVRRLASRAVAAIGQVRARPGAPGGR